MHAYLPFKVLGDAAEVVSPRDVRVTEEIRLLVFGLIAVAQEQLEKVE